MGASLSGARVIKLTRFDAGQVKPLHKAQEKSNG